MINNDRLLLPNLELEVLNNKPSAYTVSTEAKSKTSNNELPNKIVYFHGTNSDHTYIQDANNNLLSDLTNAESLYIDEMNNEDDKMDDNKLLEMYISKVDKDQSELKHDMRESEKRLENHIVASEHRMDERLNRIEILINSQNDKVDKLKDEVSKQLSDDKKYRHTNNIAIALGVIATVIAMVGIYYATVSMITDIIGVALKS